jgi:hypothetical protein
MVQGRGEVARLGALAYLAAAGLVLPLVAAEVWSGFRLALADNVLATISVTEQPLSVRTPGGQWAILLALLWFALAYWQRRMRWWEPLLVVLGGTAALLRTGNGWLDAIALIAPLGARLAYLRVPRGLMVGAAVVGACVAAFTLWTTRPPSLPQAAVAAAQSGHGTVLADWRWAPQLQRDLGTDRRVLASGGLASETPDFWLDYVRVVQDFEKWPDELRGLNADVLVLPTDQPVTNQVRSSSDWHVVYDSEHVLVAEREGV